MPNVPNSQFSVRVAAYQSSVIAKRTTTQKGIAGADVVNTNHTHNEPKVNHNYYISPIVYVNIEIISMNTIYRCLSS